MSIRIERLKHKLINHETASPEWTLLMYDSLKRTEDKPMFERRAEAFKHVLANVALEIDDDELVVGRLPKRYMTPEDEANLEKAREYFRENKLAVGPCYAVPWYLPERDRFVGYEREGLFTVMRLYLHCAPDTTDLLARGWDGIAADIENRMVGDDLEADQKRWLEASLQTVRAASDFILRYADLAQQQAADAISERKEELQGIATRCRWIATRPPRDFREALQLLWFHYVLMNLEVTDHWHASGFALDLELKDYYAADLASGVLTREEAIELVECVCLAMNIPHPRGDVLPIILGGLGPGGSDQSSDLTDVCLEACENVGLLNPSLTLRCTKGMPRERLTKAVNMWRSGHGFPQLFNDEIATAALMKSGVQIEDTYKWLNSTCTELTSIGRTNAWISQPYFNMAKPLELVLNNGKSILTGEQISEDRGNLADYSDFGSLYQSYLTELAKWIGVSVEVHNKLEETQTYDTPQPFLSATVKDCISKARDYSNGGPRYNPSYIQAIGISTVVDSLVAIRDLVFGKGEVSAQRMLDAIRANYENDDDLHNIVKNHPAKYGNDIDDVDSLFVDISNFFYDEVCKYSNTRGGKYYPGYMVFLSHEWLGTNTGAMPDGRLARAALSDSVGAVQGMDRKGITALFKSATKNDYHPAVGGVTFNVRLMPSLFDEEDSIDKLVSAVKAYFALGGLQIQANVVDSKILREAQSHPEDYRDLMVRVGGFSAYFTGLAASLQEEIIKRTEHVG